MRAGPLAKKFAQIAFGDYRASMQFISDNPSILSERDSDGLLVEAFDAQTDGKAKYAKGCVHQSLLISYCRQLGRDGVGLFFKRITTKGHQAQSLFLNDVHDTYGKIVERAAVLAKERAESAAAGEDREQIQLHAVDPGTTINIVVPPPIPADLGPAGASTQPPPSEDHIAARRLFETFPPGLQRALESGSLDEVNVVLGKMSVSEAEEVVDKLGQGGMLSLEAGVIDATNAEGQALVEEIERTRRMPGEHGDDVVEMSEDPPLD